MVKEGILTPNEALLRVEPTANADEELAEIGRAVSEGSGGFSEMLKHYEAHSPLKRNVLPAELGATGLFLASDGAAAITGQVLYVDCGYQIMGM